MPRPLLNGYSIAADEEVALIDKTNLPLNLPLLNLKKRGWVLLTNATASLNINNGFEAFPQEILPLTVTEITVSTTNYTLDLSQAGSIVILNLATNTTLNLVGANVTYLLVNLNGFTVKNWNLLFYNETLIRRYRFGLTEQVFKNIEKKLPYAKLTTPDLYYSFYTELPLTGVVGNPTIEKNRLLLQAGRLQFDYLDLNETDFTFSVFFQNKTLADQGIIFSAGRNFYAGFEFANLLRVKLPDTDLLSVIVVPDLREHFLFVVRVGSLFKIYLDGLLVAHQILANNFFSLYNFMTLGSLTNTVGLPSWTAQAYEGYLRDFAVDSTAVNIFDVESWAANDVVRGAFLVKSAAIPTPLFTSTRTPFVVAGRITSYSHLSYAGSGFNFGGNVTLEAVVYNPTGNTRATILHSEGNFHWGIYDGYLRIDFGIFSMTGTTQILNDVEVSLAFTKTGTAVKLYINGIVDAADTTAESMFLAGTSPELSVKRVFSQDSADAVQNTTLYPSRSLMEIKELRITPASRYNSDYLPNFNYEI